MLNDWEYWLELFNFRLDHLLGNLLDLASFLVLLDSHLHVLLLFLNNNGLHNCLLILLPHDGLNLLNFGDNLCAGDFLQDLDNLGSFNFLWLSCSGGFDSCSLVNGDFGHIGGLYWFRLLSWFLINGLDAGDFRLLFFMRLASFDCDGFALFGLNNHGVLIDELGLFNFGFLNDNLSVFEFGLGDFEVLDNEFHLGGFVLSLGDGGRLPLDWLNDDGSGNLFNIDNLYILGLSVLNDCDLLLGLLRLITLHDHLISVNHISLGFLEGHYVLSIDRWQFVLDGGDHFLDLFIILLELLNISGDDSWLSLR